MSYLTFKVSSVYEPQSSTVVLYSWSTINAAGTRVGEVGYFNHWRKYCFYPAGATTFDAGCLREIADFCESETAKRRAECKAARES